MGLFTVTVLGFAVVMGVIGFVLLSYFSKAMNSHDSINIDPKPSK